jgi:hypothetical protein
MVNRANRMFITPIKGGEGRFGIWQRTGRGSYESFRGAQMKWTLEPQPKRRASTYDLKGDLQKQVQVYWPGEIEQQLREELARAGFR